MTGAGRLRELADAMFDGSETLWAATRSDYCDAHGLTPLNNGGPLREFLADVADQAERERRAVLDDLATVSGVVLAVARDMEGRVSGVEGAEDGPVARWACELRGAVRGGERDLAEDVSVSAYDLLPEEEREAVAWVREHGRIEGLRRMFQDADSRRVELCVALGIPR